jgi:tetratricopeptide (TPR) repeat protein
MINKIFLLSAFVFLFAPDALAMKILGVEEHSSKMDVELSQDTVSLLAFESGNDTDTEIFHIVSSEHIQEQFNAAKEMLSTEALWVEGADICRSMIITCMGGGTSDDQDMLSESWTLLGSFLEKRQETEKAFSCYNKSLEIDPEFFRAYKKKGLLFQKSKNFPEAIQCLQQALKCTESSSSSAKICLILGGIYYHPQIKDDKNALLYFEVAWNAIALMPEEKQLHLLKKQRIEAYFFCRTLMRNNSHPVFLKNVCEKTAQLFEPQSPFFKDLASNLLLQENKMDQSISNN